MEFSDRNMTERHPVGSSLTYFDVISCCSEHELSQGSEKILREQGICLLAYIKKNLVQYNLQKKYQEYDIFNESYDRAIKAIRKEKTIHNLYGWYRITTLNVIREYGRNEDRQKNIKKMFDSCVLEPDLEEHPRYPGMDLEKIKKIMRSDLDYKIVFLRVVEDKSWEEVCKVLIEDKDFNCEVSKQFVARIRQRFHRALKRFHKALKRVSKQGD